MVRKTKSKKQKNTDNIILILALTLGLMAILTCEFNQMAAWFLFVVALIVMALWALLLI